jgi:hypothetical protein
VDEDVHDPAAHQADGAGEFVADPVGDELRRATRLEHLHGRRGDRALDAAAGDRAFDPALVVDVHGGPDVQGRGPFDLDEQPRRDASSLTQPARDGGGGVLDWTGHGVASSASL